MDDIPEPFHQRRTPGLLLGPFYPLDPPAGSGTELWRSEPLPPAARKLSLAGRLINLKRVPIAGACVEIWHADYAGRYRHPSEGRVAEVGACFAGYGKSHTDQNGCFAFSSVVPGPYGDNGTLRAPHVHVQVTGRKDRLVTQMFLPNHPLNCRDRWFNTIVNSELLLPDVLRDDRSALSLRWTVVLAGE